MPEIEGKHKLNKCCISKYVFIPGVSEFLCRMAIAVNIDRQFLCRLLRENAFRSCVFSKVNQSTINACVYYMLVCCRCTALVVRNRPTIVRIKTIPVDNSHMVQTTNNADNNFLLFAVMLDNLFVLFFFSGKIMPHTSPVAASIHSGLGVRCAMCICDAHILFPANNNRNQFSLSYWCKCASDTQWKSFD